MFRRGPSRGEGNLGCILWAILLGLVVLIAVKAVPVKISSSELYDYMLEQVKLSPNTPPELMEKRILQKARELDLPLDKKGLEVERVGDRIRITANYTVPVEFPGYTYQWEFRHAIDRSIFIF